MSVLLKVFTQRVATSNSLIGEEQHVNHPNGNNADGDGDNPPNNTQDSSNGEDAGKRERNHDSIVHEGHSVHPSQVQRMNATPNFPNEVLHNNSDPTMSVDNASIPVDAFSVTEQQTAFVQNTHFAEPQNSYAPIGRQHV